MPQVASDPAIRPARSEPAGKPAAADQPSGLFGEMLDASTGPSDSGGTKPVPANAKESPAPAVPGDQPCEPIQASSPAIPPVIAIDLALLAPELPADGSAGTPAAAHEKDEASAGEDAAPEGNKAEAAGDAAGLTIDANAADVALIAVVVPAPAPPVAPIPTQTDADAAVIASDGTAPPIAAAPKSAPAEVPPQVVAAVADLPPAATSDNASPPVAAQPGNARPEAVSANKTAAPDEPAQAEAAVLPLQAEAKPSARPLERVQGTDDDKAVKSTKAAAHPAANAAHPGEPVRAPTDARHPSDQPADQDAKPSAHQPHEQPSERASATARVAFTAAHNDLASPTSVAQAVTAQLGANPPALGLNPATPLASPVPVVWQVTAQHADAGDSAVPVSGVAVEIVSRAQDGLRRFEIRLDPPELGRIDVRLDVDRGGNVTSRLTVERAETLDLLRRDAPQLERALQQAGLNTDGGLQFSLRDQNFTNREQTPRGAAIHLIVPDDDATAAEAARRGYGRLTGLGGGIDIRV